MTRGRDGLTRREALAFGATGALTLGGFLGGCSAGSGGVGGTPAPDGSTLRTRWGDPVGDGQLRVLGGEPLRPRTELGPAASLEGTLATFAHVTDAHVMDAASPARVPFLDRLGPPFQSTFRPHEALTARVFAGAMRAVGALAPDAVIQGGDLIDNDQANELACALAILGGSGTVDPGYGPHGYYGVQSFQDPDPFYYRPDLDAPRHRGLLAAASATFAAPHAGAPVYPVLGDHDILVQGELVPTAELEALALGSRALWDLPKNLALPPGFTVETGGSPDGPLLPSVVGQLLQEALSGATVRVPSMSARRPLSVTQVLDRLGGGPAGSFSSGRADYGFDLGADVRVIVLDLARRDGGSGGLVVAGQSDFLASELAAAGRRWVIVVSHQPLISSEGGADLLAVLDAHPRVIAAFAGHIHRNSIQPRRTAAGGYWLITTASLIDYPQQARAVRVRSLRGGGVALQTWMLDHVDVAHGSPLNVGLISRQLSYLDAQGGRPGGFSATPLDRNVTLYRAAV